MNFLIATLLASSLYVIDGDTADVDGHRVRLATIDAPEIFSPKCDAEMELGLRAAVRLEELLKSGDLDVSVGDPASGRRVDRYGRALVTIRVNGEDVGKILIRENLARPWRGRREGWC